MTPTSAPKVSLNGVLQDAASARVSPLSEGFLFGLGLFETMRLVGGRLAFFRDHFQRLSSSCAALGVNWRGEEAELRSRCEALAAANQLSDGVVKTVVFAEGEGAGELITTRAFVYSTDLYRRGFRLRAQQVACGAGGRSAHKTTSYLHHLKARETARAAGGDDALYVAVDGQVLEGSATNLFVVKGGEVLTPPASAGILPGVAREQLLRRVTGRVVREAVVTRQLLEAADEVFVTNALLGVMPVAAVDARAYSVERYSVVPELMQAYADWTAASIA